MSPKNRPESLALDGRNLKIEDVIAVAREARPVRELAPGSPLYERVQAGAEWVRATVEENARRAQAGEEARAYYGINTGFGVHAASRPLADPELTRHVSRKLVMSHAVGVGDYLDEEIVRAAMLIRANMFVKGYSGVRPIVIDRLIQMLNRGIVPAIPQMGSLGASGDLVPLAHLALVMSQSPDSLRGQDGAPGFEDVEGEVLIPGYDPQGRGVGRKVVSGAEAMTWEGADQRLVLEAKEGLALSNGAAFSAALAVLALNDAENLVRHAEIAVAMTLEALHGYRDAFLPPVHAVRGHPGQIATAANVLAMVEGSQLVDPGDVDRDPVYLPPQDAYSLRCAPQVIGAIRESLAHLHTMIEREVNAATDNPLIFINPEDGLTRPYKAISGGNFHGEILALGLDQLGVAVTELGNISERRSFWMLNPPMARGLPSMLISGGESRMDSGLMLAQYVAAALVSKCKTLSHPDSVDSIPTSANQEDHVSMSMNAGLHAREIVEHVTAVIAIELLTATLALRQRLAGWRRDGTLGSPRAVEAFGTGTRAVWAAIEEHAPQILEIPLDHDVIYFPYLRMMTELVKHGILPDAVRAAGISFKEVKASTELIP